MATNIAFVGSSNNLEVNGLKAEIEDIFLNDATITVTIKDLDGNNLAGEMWPQHMQYIPGTNGNYVMNLTRFAALVKGTKYTAFIDADASDSTTERFAHWEFGFTAQVRTK